MHRKGIFGARDWHRRRNIRSPAATDRELRGALEKALLAPDCCRCHPTFCPLVKKSSTFWIPNSVCLDWGSGKAAPVRIKIKNEVWEAERDVYLDEKISGKSGEQYQVTLFFEKLPEQVQQFNFVIPDFISWEGITVK